MVVGVGTVSCEKGTNQIGHLLSVFVISNYMNFNSCRDLPLYIVDIHS